MQKLSLKCVASLLNLNFKLLLMLNTIPITVVSLAKDEERRKHIAQECKALGLNYKLFDAIDGSTLTQTEIDKVYTEKDAISAIGRGLSRGEIGCALSHLGVYKKMLSENIKTMIILEDDARLSPEFKEALQITYYLPKDWEILLLGYSLYRRHVWYKLPIKVPNLKWRIAKAIRLCCGTHAYIIRQNAAKKILAQAKKLYKPIDHYTGDFITINLFLIMPCVASGPRDTEASTSIIEKEREVIRSNAHNIPQQNNISIMSKQYFLSANQFLAIRKYCYIFREYFMHIKNKVFTIKKYKD